jgi:secondary thiamine-phosphate synthase enzyme
MTQTTRFTITTNEPHSFTDLTERINAWIAKQDILDGLLLIRTLHTTTAIFVNEHERGFLQDLDRLLCELAPVTTKYQHDDFSKRLKGEADERVNGFAHLQASLLGSQVIIPITNGKLVLGQWQSILFAELDGPRKERCIECRLIS